METPKKAAVIPAKELTIKILDNEYKLSIPNVGQFIDIQTMKVRLAGESYDGLFSEYESDKAYAKLLVDLISCYSVLIPAFKDDLNVESISQLDMIAARDLTHSYMKEFMPWYRSILAYLGSDDEHTEVIENTEKTSSLAESGQE